MIEKADADSLLEIKQLLTGIGVISKLAMMEQSSKAGDKTRKSVRRAFIASKTNWTQAYVDGRRVLKKRDNYKYVLGRRVAHRHGGGTDDPANMANFITSFTMKTTGTTVVGGTHKAHSPIQIKNGKVIGKLSRQAGISQQTIAILEKLNYGGKRKTMGKFASKLAWRNGSKSMKFQGRDAEELWKPRHFFEKGWNSVKGQVVSDMTTELARLIGERANNTDLRGVKEYAL